MAVYAGLQITPTQVKAALCGESGGKFEILDAVTVGYADNAELAEALSECRSRFEIHSPSWCAGMPAEEFSFRHLSFPFKKRKEIEAALGYELETVLPYSASSMETSAVILSTGETTKVLASAVLRERVDYWRDMLAKAGIYPRVLTADAEGLRFFHSRFLKAGGAALLISADAGRLAVCYSGDNGFMDFHVSSAASQAIRVFEAEYDTENRYLGGSDAETLQSEYAYSTDWAENLGITSELEIPPANLIIPIGLAVRGMTGIREGINFTPQANLGSLLASGNRLQIIGAAAVFFLWVGLVAYGNHLKQQELGLMKNGIKTIFRNAAPGSKPVKPVFQLKRKLAKLQDKVESYGLAAGGRKRDLLGLLKMLSETMPGKPKTIIDELNYDPKSVSLLGRTDSFEAVEKIKKLIADTGLYRNVEVIESQTSADKKSVTFRIRMKA